MELVGLLAGLATILLFVFGQKGLVEHWREWQKNREWLKAKQTQLSGKHVDDGGKSPSSNFLLSESQAEQISAIVAGANVIYRDVEKAVSTAEAVKRKAYEKKYLASSITKYVKTLELSIEDAQKNTRRDDPYKELLEYDIRDIAFFYGRSKDTNELLHLIEGNSLTILHAESGAGKTSLLKAGVRPHLLANGHVPIYINLRGLPPNTSIQKTIKQNLLPEIGEYPSLVNTSLQTFLKEATSLLGKKWLVIIIDQFEEFFTTQNSDVRTNFLEDLATCINDDLLQVRWILSLRREWFSQLSTFRPFIANPFNSEYFLSPLSREEATQAIIYPSRQAGVDFEEILVDTILGDLSINNFYPPHLQLVCSELFKSRQKKSLITEQEYVTLGRLDGILGEYLQRVLERDISPSRRVLAQRLLVALVTSDRRAHSRTKDELASELNATGTDVKFLDEVIGQLVDSRLLKTVESTTGETPSFLLAHDYLVDKVELDPDAMRLKVAQELIDQKIPYFNRDGLLLSADELRRIKPYEKWLNLTDKASELVLKSKKKKWIRLFYYILMGFASALSMITINYLFLYSRFLESLPSLVPSSAPTPLSNSSGGVSFVYLFWLFVFLFSIIGMLRGWAKELLVGFAVIVAIAFNMLLERYALPESMTGADLTLFWIRVIILAALVLFGYQTVISVARFQAGARRERLQDSIFGLFLGSLNGYLIAGTTWFYLDAAHYPFPNVFIAPSNETLAQINTAMMSYMPPHLLGEPSIYFAILIVLIFILVVYV